MDKQWTGWKDIGSEALRSLGVHLGAIGIIGGLIVAVGYPDPDITERTRLDNEMLDLAASDGPRANRDRGNLIIAFDDYPAQPAAAATTPVGIPDGGAGDSGIGEAGAPKRVGGIAPARSAPPLPPRRPAAPVLSASRPQPPASMPAPRPATAVAAAAPKRGAPLDLCIKDCDGRAIRLASAAPDAAPDGLPARAGGKVLNAGNAILAWASDASGTMLDGGKRALDSARNALW